MSDRRYNRPLHTVALLTAAATFPLIFMGGLVTSHQAGMSVPDWPNSYGYNMFLFPPRLWIGGIFYEHTHRLMGTVVGMLAIMQTIVAWRTEPRRWVRWLSIGVLAAVIVQGVLGGLRVVLVELDLAILHACFAQAFFCLTALMCVVTSRWWSEAPRLKGADRSIVWLAGLCVVAIYLQLIVGALMRHYGVGLAIPDLPLAYGKLLPPVTAADLAATNQYRAFVLHQPKVSMLQVWLHFGHRIGAVVVTLAVIALSMGAIAKRRSHPGILALAIALLVLLGAQLTLGVFTVLKNKPADLASAHVAVGALLLVTAFVILTRAARLCLPRLAMQRQRRMELHGAMAIPA